MWRFPGDNGVEAGAPLIEISVFLIGKCYFYILLI